MPLKTKPIPYTREELHDFFRYDPETGKLYWKISNSNVVKVGDEAGSINSCGYKNVKLNGRTFKNHRIIYKMFHDNFDEYAHIDHIDGETHNNRIENLRMVTHSENLKNKRIYKNNKTGEVGISFYKRLNKWEVNCRINNLRFYGGRYSDFQEAIKVRGMLYEKHSFHPNHGRKQISV